MPLQQAKPKKGHDSYLDLVLRFPLRPIHNETELDRAIAIIDELLDQHNLDSGERDYLDVLSDLVERYEEETYPDPAVADGPMLRFLMEAKEVNQKEVAKGTKIATSTISEVLAGKRLLNRGQIGQLARYFHVEPSVFSFDASPS